MSTATNTRGPLILIGIPTFGQVSMDWVMGRERLSTPLGAAIQEQWAAGPMGVAEKRNMIAKNALEMGAKYLFFLGDDTIPPAHALMQLVQRAQQSGAKIISGMYFSRSLPPQPMVWRGWMQGSYYDWHVGEFFQTDWAGCDCLLIDTDVLRTMPEPWFSEDYVFGPEQEKPSALATEDVYFYEKARHHGFSAWVDAGVQCVHQDRTTGASYSLPSDWPQNFQPGTPEGDTSKDPLYMVADLGCGTSSPYTHGRLIRFDINEAVNPDIRTDLHSLPVPDQSYDEVWSRHVLEHFSGNEAPFLIQEWARILKIGGTFKVNVPNLETAMKHILEGVTGDLGVYSWWQVYGAQEDEHDYHKNGFVPVTLEKLLKYAWGDSPIHGVNGEGEVDDGVGCFDDIQVTVTENGLNLQAIATKVRHHKAAVIGPSGRHSMYKSEAEPLVVSEPVEQIAVLPTSCPTSVPEVVIGSAEVFAINITNSAPPSNTITVVDEGVTEVPDGFWSAPIAPLDHTAIKSGNMQEALKDPDPADPNVRLSPRLPSRMNGPLSH